jgi:7-carboxy-7-deazaguanine synthase
MNVVAAASIGRPSGDAAAALRLKITEVFHSVQGEGLHSGWPSVFVRLTGCPLRCRYCDTAYAFGGGEWWTCGEIVERVRSFGARHVCVTGGEPLAQPRCLALLEMLCDAGYQVCLETGGAHDIAQIDPRVSRIVDVKTPGSGECTRNRLENLALLTWRDALKIVVTSRDDYEWARAFVRTHEVPCPVFFSPSFIDLPPADLADWILEDRLPVRLQVQLHKVLWGDTPGR